MTLFFNYSKSSAIYAQISGIENNERGTVMDISGYTFIFSHQYELQKKNIMKKTA